MTLTNKPTSSKLMKSLLALTLGATLITVSPLPASATSKGLTISLNGQVQTFAVPPMIIEDRMYVPVRALLEAYGYQVKWDPFNRMVFAEKGKQSLSFSLDFPTVMYIDAAGSQSLPDVKIKVIEGSSMIPTRLLSEALGMEVRWDEGTQTVFIDSSKTALFDAIMLDDVSTVRKLLASGTDPNSRYRFKSAMRYAVSSQNPAIVKLLLEKGASVTEDDLWAATIRGDAELVHFLLTNSRHEKSTADLATQLLSNAFTNTEMILTLLELGADPNKVKSGNGDSALAITSMTGDSVAFEALLKAGADPNAVTTTLDNHSYPLLLQLVNQGNVDLTQLLLESKANPNIHTGKGWTPLMIAADNGNAKLAQLLLAHGAKIDAKNAGGATALDIALAHGNTATAQVLTAAGAQASSGKLPEEALFLEHPELISSLYRTALDAAVALGHTEQVKQLLEEDSQQDETIRQAIKTTVHRGTVETLQTLLDNFHEVPTHRLLIQAMQVGNQEALRLLAARIAADPMTNPDYVYLIPMSLDSSRLNSVYSYNILLEAGFDANAMLDDATGLMHTAVEGSLGITELLVAAGADVNLTNSDGETALDIAIRRGHTKTANILLAAKDLAQATKDNALLTAIKRDNLDMVDALLQAGADPEFKTPAGRTPLQAAEELGNRDLLTRLQSALNQH